MMTTFGSGGSPQTGPVSSLLPYHGTGYGDRAADLPQIMRPLTCPEPTLGLPG